MMKSSRHVCVYSGTVLMQIITFWLTMRLKNQRISDFVIFNKMLDLFHFIFPFWSFYSALRQWAFKVMQPRWNHGFESRLYSGEKRIESRVRSNRVSTLSLGNNGHS
jgi:hypothetical protein